MLKPLVCLFLTGLAAAQQAPVASRVRQFEETHDLVAKEKALNLITQPGSAAGPLLLQLAKTTNDSDTRWMAIRGLGTIKFAEAAPFLVESLNSPEHYVRANAARALGEIGYSPANPALIRLLAAEPDGSVIEQTSLALKMLKAREAVPVLKSRISVPSMQTRCWILGALAQLGSKDDVPFIAQYLGSANSDIASEPFCAAQALAQLTGEDFGLPKGSGLFDPGVPVVKARRWWEQRDKR